jgi:hypothetical protein
MEVASNAELKKSYISHSICIASGVVNGHWVRNPAATTLCRSKFKPAVASKPNLLFYMAIF